jgi:hypothetical protein
MLQSADCVYNESVATVTQYDAVSSMLLDAYSGSFYLL